MKAAVFFDRDGTLIYDKVYLNDPQGVEFIPGAMECLKALKNAGFLLIVVTNQSGIARGLVQEENLHKIHERMQELAKPHGFQFDDFFFSPHAADSDHPTRKPNAGMLEEAIKKHHIDRGRSWMVGDKMIDVEAGHRAQIQSILVGGGDHSSTYQAPEHICELQDITNYIIQQDRY
jgi:D-glycero-D-manno-heptose 1,7-bisphosphate phosphatase